MDGDGDGGVVGDVDRQWVVTPNGTVIPNTNYPLKRVFYGMAYVPLNAQLPTCYNTQQSVDDEIQLLAQATKRIRLYGTDCNVLRYTLNSIQRLKLDLKIIVGIWIDTTNATYARQRDEFYSVVATYGWDNIIGVSVGNEVLFDKYQPEEVLLASIKEVKAKVVALGHPEIPVFTSDLESANRPPLTNNEDKAGVNLHPFFAGVPVSDAASWFWSYLNNTVKGAVNTGNTTPIDVWITEVGWPTFPANGNINASIPSIPNLQTFIDTWLCEANANNTPYYFFEFFDAPWKIWPGSAVEGFWGLMTIDKKLKVKLPDCLAN
ncbi:glycoside hydrolase family 17 protein [Dissophora ornata]|nr:glycoside hydrolase family 17 protein [Dissophora ornata]